MRGWEDEKGLSVSRVRGWERCQWVGWEDEKGGIVRKKGELSAVARWVWECNVVLTMGVDRCECCFAPSHCLQQYVECITEVHAGILLFRYLQQALQGEKGDGVRKIILWKKTRAKIRACRQTCLNFALLIHTVVRLMGSDMTWWSMRRYNTSLSLSLSPSLLLFITHP